MHSNLCLGTAQFGMNYGVTNLTGKINDEQINIIFKNAIKSDVEYFDTANAYGNSESIIGDKLNNKNIKIITKFSSNVTKSFKTEDINILEFNFQKSLSRLKRKEIDGYLLHNPDDLRKENNHLLINWLKSLKEKGLIKRTGISIYEESDLEGISLKDIEIIQIPISIYDQRLIKSQLIEKLLEKNISIHVRSIFLQGLLLQKASKWPNFINQSFKNHHSNYEKKVYSNNLSLLDSAISFIKKLDFPELVLFGVSQISELDSILNSWNSQKVLENNIDYGIYQWNHKNDIDPRKWVR